uniref:Transmembrane protein 131-like N-terminal domain-containing protein n=1 Tax=Clastoptera arizonana TaxID=38151 RepID=A0A1B6C098_9HEMI
MIPVCFFLEVEHCNSCHLKGITTHKDTMPYFLPPLSNITLRVGFSPQAAQTASSFLILRNNLTVVEVLQMHGSGAYTQFKFGNRKPGSSTPLVFELAEKHLKDCEREKQRKFPSPNVTVKRSFTARNIGALPISIRGFHISGLPCEGYGFRVLNCEPFYLEPNGTRKVDIAFTPDFTLTRVQRTLSVLTSEGEFGAANYTLVATLPPYLLASCSGVLARPSWEPLLYYSAVTFMIFLLMCVLAAAFLESDKVLKSAVKAMTRETATLQPVLDLRLVGAGVEIGSSNSVKKNEENIDSPAWTPVQNIDPSSITGQEVIKDSTKTEPENVAAVFSSSINKCNKKKLVANKRVNETTESNVDTVQSKDCGSINFKVIPTENHAVKKSSPFPSINSNGSESTSFPMEAASKQGDKIEQTKCTQKEQFNGSKVASTQRILDVPKDNNRRRFGGSKKCSSSNNAGCFNKQAIRENTASSNIIASISNEDVETSSTTTESSTHDDGDKEVEITMSKHQTDGTNQSQKALKVRNKLCNIVSNGEMKQNIAAERSGGSASSFEPDWDDDDHAVKDSCENKRKNHPNGRNARKQGGRNGKINDPGNTLRQRNGNNGNKQQNKLKEKQGLGRKRSNDKSAMLNKGLLPPMFDNASVPPPPPTIWGDSRASFSDVVARTDSYSNVVAPRHNLDSNPPNFKQPSASISSVSAPLGPIGPRKSSPINNWSNWTECNDQIQSPLTTSTSSFYMDTLDSIQPVQPGGFSMWSENTLLKTLQAEEQRRLDEEEYKRRTAIYHDTWTSYWNPVLTPNSVTATPTLLETQAGNTSLMWHSDVWAPTPPPAAPWAPPGLAPPPLRDDQHILPATGTDVEHAHEYDPFRSLSDIWSPHSSDIWKPPSSK